MYICKYVCIPVVRSCNGDEERCDVLEGRMVVNRRFEGQDC